MKWLSFWEAVFFAKKRLSQKHFCENTFKTANSKLKHKNYYTIIPYLF